MQFCSLGSFRHFPKEGSVVNNIAKGGLVVAAVSVAATVSYGVYAKKSKVETYEPSPEAVGDPVG
jgi:hypothetical protein